MGAVLLWWLALSAMGWLAWPLAAAIFRHLPDRGYAGARCLGLLLYAYLYWLLGVAGLTPNTAEVAWGLAAGLVLASGLAWRGQRAELSACLRREWRHILAVEVLFVVALLLYAVHKAHDPAINHTEEPMDFAFLNGILRSPRVPPRDPWMAGKSISYYYLGYLAVALLTRLTALSAGVGYNLGLAHTWALAMVGWYGVLAALPRSGRDSARPHHGAAGWAAAGAVAIGLAGNLEGILELLRARGWLGEASLRWWSIPGLAQAAPSGGWLPAGDWWWWRASRIIADYNILGKTPTVITEFPSFSLILGDLHPHVMALPYGALALLLAIELYHRGRNSAVEGGRCDAAMLVAPLIVGALGFVNSWDLPTFSAACLLALGCGLWHSHSSARLRLMRLGAWAFGLVGGSILLYLPFYLTLHSQAQGIGLSYYTKTPLKHYVLGLGLWLGPILGDAVMHFVALRRDAYRWARGRAPWVIAAGIILAPWALTALWGGWGRLLLGIGSLVIAGPWLLLLLGALLAILVVNVLAFVERGEGARIEQLFSHGSALVGLGLTYAAEFVYLRDLFDARMNTMFKLYYQAWVLLGVAAILAAWRLWQGGGRWGRRITILSGLILVASLYYPFAAAYTKAHGYRAEPTLDGTAHLVVQAPDAYAVYLWLNEHAKPHDILVEAVGEEYQADTNRLSAWTGVPTILGWPGHETQWRGSRTEVLRRAADVEAIYTSSDPQRVLSILREYQVTYLYVGAVERDQYHVDDERQRWYASFLELVCLSGAQRLYYVPVTN